MEWLDWVQGSVLHVMNRGDRREAIVEDDQDRERLLETLTEACQKTGWQVHAHCLMGNHFHLVAGGPVVGGVGHTERQPGGAAGVCGANGVAAEGRFAR